MKYLYHGNKNNGEIKELLPNFSRDGYVYATNRLIALTYIASVYPNRFTTDENGKEIFEEIVPDLFEKTC